MNTASRFGIQRKVAEKIVSEIQKVVRDNWERLAKENGLSRGQIEYMRPAFNECYI